MEKKSAHDLILETLSTTSVLKQDVFQLTKDRFAEFKMILEELAGEWHKEISGIDKRVEIKYLDRSEFECELIVAGDRLIFNMHTNVFQFDSNNALWQTSYLKDNPNNAYCGTIRIYNFLNDSFKLRRTNDVGYMIARVFINSQNHFFVQGKRQLGFLFNDFKHAELSKAEIKRVVESAVLYTLSFDLYIPPYSSVQEVTVSDILDIRNNVGITTGKRLGYKFQSELEELE